MPDTHDAVPERTEHAALEENSDSTIVTITGSEADAYWEKHWTPKAPLPGRYPLNGLARMDRATIYGSKEVWLAYDVVTTAISPRYHLAQTQGVTGIMLEEAAKMRVIAVMAEVGHGDVVRETHLFQGDRAVADFGTLVSENPGATLLCFNGFRFDNTVLEAHGLSLAHRSAIDLFLEVFRCVVPLHVAGVLRDRRGWGLDQIAATLFGLPDAADLSFERIAQLLESGDEADVLQGSQQALLGVRRCVRLWQHVKSHSPVRSQAAPGVEIELWH